jgi:hypothetical protein
MIAATAVFVAGAAPKASEDLKPYAVIGLDLYSPTMSSVPGYPFTFGAMDADSIEVTVDGGMFFLWEGSGTAPQPGTRELRIDNGKTIYWAPTNEDDVGTLTNEDDVGNPIQTPESYTLSARYFKDKKQFAQGVVRINQADTMRYTATLESLSSGDASPKDLPSDVDPDQPKPDAVVVFWDLSVTAGQSAWDEFAEQCENGEAASIRLAYFYTGEEPPQISEELYEQEKDRYPALYVQDLNYDGKQYTLAFAEEGKIHRYAYPYMKHYTGAPSTPDATYSKYDRYVLVMDDGVTWDQLESGMYGAQSTDHIDHFNVYTNLIP